MQSRYFRHLISMLLSATLLVSSIMPLGFRHAHAGGNDRSHRHIGDSTALLDHQRHVPCENCSKHCNGCQSHSIFIVGESFGQYASHFHLICFGFQLTLVDLGHSGKDSNDRQSAYVRVSEYLKPIPQHFFSVVNLLTACQAFTTNATTAIYPVVFSSQMVTTTLLCDRVRHERSGVQLI